MPDDPQNPAQGSPPDDPPPKPKRQGKPKYKSGRPTGRPPRSVMSAAEQIRIEREVFDLRAHGAQWNTIAQQVKRNEDQCQVIYKRARDKISLQGIEDARIHAQHILHDELLFVTTRMRQMRNLLIPETPEQQQERKEKKLGPREKFDVREYVALAMLKTKLLERESKMMGYDAPSTYAWSVDHGGSDLLTEAQLDNLTVNELVALFSLLEKARGGAQERNTINVTPTKPPDDSGTPPQLPPPPTNGANGAVQ